MGELKAFLSTKPGKLSIGVVAAAALIILPQLGFIVDDPEGVLPISTLVYMAIYALFAMGLNIVVGFAGLLDLGYVAFFLFGAYVGGWLMSDFAVQVTGSWADLNIHILDAARPVIDPVTGLLGPANGIHVSFWLVAIVAAIVAAIAGIIIGAPTLRLKSDYLALVTLGFGEILPEVFRNGDDVGGLNLTSGTVGIGPLDPIGTGLGRVGVPDVVTVNDPKWRYYIILVICVAFAWISIKLRDGRLGRAWMAIREDELAASLMGVPLQRTKLWSYAVGAAAGGVGGAFYATVIGIVTVDSFKFQFSIIILCAVILGGMGNVWGAILGGAVITWFNYTGLTWTGANVLHYNIKQYEFAIFGLVLVLMMLFRPDGFLPAARSKQVRQAEKAVLAAQDVAL